MGNVCAKKAEMVCRYSARKSVTGLRCLFVAQKARAVRTRTDK